MYWYRKSEPFLLLILLIFNIFLFFTSVFFSQYSIGCILTVPGLRWGFFVLIAILTLFISHHYLFPSAILSISARSTSNKENPCKLNNLSLISVLFDGKTITFKADKDELPQQVRLYFWKKGEYKVYVKYTTGNGDTKCESGIINLYEDRHVEIEIPSS